MSFALFQKLVQKLVQKLNPPPPLPSYTLILCAVAMDPTSSWGLIRVIHDNPAPQFLTLLAAMDWHMTQLWLRKHEKFLMLELWGNFDFPTSE